MTIDVRAENVYKAVHSIKSDAAEFGSVEASQQPGVAAKVLRSREGGRYGDEQTMADLSLSPPLDHSFH